MSGPLRQDGKKCWKRSLSNDALSSFPLGSRRSSADLSSTYFVVQSRSEREASPDPRRPLRPSLHYSHSIVPGGFEVMSYTTRFTPRTSFTIRFEIVFSTSYGSGTQSAVMPSSECTARTAQV